MNEPMTWEKQPMKRVKVKCDHKVPLIYGNLTMGLLFSLHPEGPAILVVALLVAWMVCQGMGRVFDFLQRGFQ